MAIGLKLKLRLFLEGIEVPVIGAAIQAAVNAPATASIQVIPTDRILELKPRTMVHLFYWDFNKDLPTDAPTATGDSSDPNSTLRGYRLAFAGEMVGLVFLKTPTGRQTVLQCADFSTYWDTTYQIFISYSPNGNFLADNSSAYGGGNSMFDNISSSHSGVMNSYLNSRPKTEGLQDVQGLMGGIISLLEAMGGVPNHVSGVNDFFTIAELKNHILQQIVAEQNDDTAKQLFDSKAFSEWLNRGVTSMGELVSFRDMMKLLFHWIYYEVVPVTSPMFIKAVPPTTTETVSQQKARAASLLLGETQRFALRKWLSIVNLYNCSLGLGVTIHNQIDAGEILAFKDLVTDLKQFLATNDIPPQIKALLDPIVAQDGSIKSISHKFSSDVLRAALPAKVQDQKTTPTRATGTGDVVNDLNILYDNQRFWQLITNNINKATSAVNPGSPAVTKKKVTKTRPTLDRLQSQIFRPDCFFVAPPRCNVLFPDQYTQFQFQRSFLQEVTRLRLSVGLEFISGHDSGLLTPIYFSPSNISVSQSLAKKPGSAGIRTLLPWEKYTGILPKFESISEVNYLANKRQRTLQQNVKGQGAAYSQRAADFNFLKYRFAPRTLVINAKYSPQFVMGFPGLVIDRPFILDPSVVNQAIASAGVSNASDFTINDILANISTLASYFKAPTQYLGMPSSVVHNIDQSGGTTSITFTHARTHRLTDDDFLASYAAEVTKKTQTQTVSTLLDADEILRSGDYKRLRFLIDATPQDQIQQATDAQTTQFADDQGNPLDVADQQPSLDLRPNGAPDLATFDQLAPAIFATPNPNFASGSTVPQSSVAKVIPGEAPNPKSELLGREFPGDTIITWVGPTTKSQLKGTSTTITVPNPYGKIKPGADGIKGGKVTQIQLLTNSVTAVSTADIEQFAQTKQDRQDLANRRKNAGKSDQIFLWRKAIVWESVTTKTVTQPIPVEETIRPPWFSPLYSNVFIGDNIYQPFFGTGSIVDEALFNINNGQGTQQAVAGTPGTTRAELLAQVEAANGDSVKIAQILDKFKATTVGAVPSIESSVDSLAYIYGEVCRQNLDVQRFIVNYTDRPIATLEDILGSMDLDYAEQNGKLVKLSGTAGFHSTAVAPFDNLLGLLDNPDVELSRIKTTGKKFPIDKSLDPRPGRRAAVEAYANDFGSQGALGVGLRG